jgi:KaiC/GvpD/RAD55 family RecA-like ATPase
MDVRERNDLSERRNLPQQRDSATLLEHVRGSQYGDHNILIYRDVETLNEIMATHYREALEQKNELALFVSQYQTIQKVRDVLEKSGLDVARHEHQGSLVILDSVKGYHGPDGSYTVTSLINMLLDRANKLEKKGMFAMADVGSFFFLDKLEALVTYELSLPSVWSDTKLRSFCLYHQRDIARLSERERQALIDHHHKFIKQS